MKNINTLKPYFIDIRKLSSHIYTGTQGPHMCCHTHWSPTQREVIYFPLYLRSVFTLSLHTILLKTIMKDTDKTRCRHPRSAEKIMFPFVRPSGVGILNHSNPNGAPREASGRGIQSYMMNAHSLKLYTESTMKNSHIQE